MDINQIMSDVYDKENHENRNVVNKLASPQLKRNH